MNIDTVMLDMDGVLANFHEGVCLKFGEPYDYSKLTKNWHFWEDWVVNKGVTGNDVNRICSADFWDGLPWMHDGREILNLVLEYFRLKDLYILTVPMRNLESNVGKMRWLQREIPELAGRVITVGQQVSKGLLAQPNVLLIDDKDSNIDEFTLAGGKTIQISRPWNKLNELADYSVDLLEWRLGGLTDGKHTKETSTTI